jgi:hypothetical protein
MCERGWARPSAKIHDVAETIHRVGEWIVADHPGDRETLLPTLPTSPPPPEPPNVARQRHFPHQLRSTASPKSTSTPSSRSLTVGGLSSHGGYDGPAVKTNRAQHGAIVRFSEPEVGLPISGIRRHRHLAGCGRGFIALGSTTVQVLHRGHALRLSHRRRSARGPEGITSFRKVSKASNELRGRAVDTVQKWRR